MELFFVGLLLGILLGWLTLGCYLNPTLGRVCIRVFAVVTLSIGVGFLVWAIVAQVMGQQTRVVSGSRELLSHNSETLALGSGFMVAGVAALVLSFVSRRRAALPPREEKGPVTPPV
jgi:hypothetical protein